MTHSHSHHAHSPILFGDSLEQGEELSPFLKPHSRNWGSHLRILASLSSVVLLIVCFALSFFPAQLALSHLLLVVVYFLAGIPALIESLENILDLDINIDVLMTLAAFSSILLGSGMEGALLLVLFELSGALEETVTHRAKSAISNLHRLAPTRATVMDPDGTLLERSVKDIGVGTTILVQAGQVVPLDGKVISGASSVNLVHLTGENLPVTKIVGDEVPAGARNQEGSLVMKVTRANADSTLARIINLVTQAQEAKPKLQRWFDQMSRNYALSIILFSTAFAMILPLLIEVPYLGHEGSIYRALAFLIAASPCALIIAIPIAYLSAIGACAREGILLKGGVTLDALASCTLIAFDKTGTLTTGDLKLTLVEKFGGGSLKKEHEAIAIACALERNAIHPIAKAVLKYAEEHQIAPAELLHFKSVPGYGLEGSVETESGPLDVYIGKPDYIVPRLDSGVQDSLKAHIVEIQSKGELLALLLVGDQLTLLHFRDNPRQGMKETIDVLKKENRWRLLMLTGDHLSSAQAIGKELGLDEFHANLTPEDKLNRVSQLSKDYGLVMIGDGINDAPALARATVGICMGKVGSSTAIDAADVVLLHDDLEKLPWLMQRSRRTQVIVRENLTLAVVAILIATTPALLGWIPLWLAVVLHEGGTVIVGLNALRLLKKS